MTTDFLRSFTLVSEWQQTPDDLVGDPITANWCVPELFVYVDDTAPWTNTIQTTELGPAFNWANKMIQQWSGGTREVAQWTLTSHPQGAARYRAKVWQVDHALSCEIKGRPGNPVRIACRNHYDAMEYLERIAARDDLIFIRRSPGDYPGLHSPLENFAYIHAAEFASVELQRRKTLITANGDEDYDNTLY